MGQSTPLSGVPECMSHTVLALGRHVHEKVIENIFQVDAFCAC